MDNMPSLEKAEIATRKLLAYCQANDWAGYDPYDALNSRVFQALPFLDSKWPRLILTQALKRSPVNIRGLALIPKTQNPKGLALFLGAMLRLSKLKLLDDERLLKTMVDRLVALRSPNTSYWCWGYSFPWQTRTLVVPRGTPNLVCTTFVADALLDAYEQLGDSRLLDMARSAAEYIVNELYWNENGRAGLSYPFASGRAPIHNANFLGAALLCRVRAHTHEDTFLRPALAVARYSAERQRTDGSWPYGELPTQGWIDNFHTGYNLRGLNSIDRYLGTREFDAHIKRGFEFYLRHFIRKDGSPRYFHDKTYPIDVHCVSQTIITLLEFRTLDEGTVDRASTVLEWAMRHMWDPKGYFYYRVLPVFRIKTSYMRWSQAWMLLALATFLEEGHRDLDRSEVEGAATEESALTGTDSRAGGRGTYVLITPARNEAAFIEGTIKSVVNQTVKPLKWVIVSDGSTDGTDDIASRYASQHEWIEVVRMPERDARDFASKVSAFNAGAARVAHLQYDYIGALDADISFDEDYFSFLLNKADQNPRLGLVGTPFAEQGVTYDYRFASVEHVSGACQFFRRRCFEDIGGYVPLKSGGIDLVAVLSARMKGWQVRTFPERTSHHHRKQGSATKSGLAVLVNDGKKDYLLGADPVWEFCRAAARTRKAPYLVGGICLFAGYFWPMLLRRPKTAPQNVIAFRRQDQKARLRALLRRLWIPASKRDSLEGRTL